MTSRLYLSNRPTFADLPETTTEDGVWARASARRGFTLSELKRFGGCKACNTKNSLTFKPYLCFYDRETGEQTDQIFEFHLVCSKCSERFSFKYKGAIEPNNSLEKQLARMT